MSNDSEFGEFWDLIFEEYKLTKKMLLKVSDFKDLCKMNLLINFLFKQEKYCSSINYYSTICSSKHKAY